MTAPENSGHEFERIDGRRVMAAIPAAVVVALVVWLLVHDEGQKSPGIRPVIATPTAIHDLATERGIPIYWLGQRPNALTELSETEAGNVFVRYLPPGVEIGAEAEDFLTVGTYPVGDGYAATKEAAKAEGAISRRAEDDALVVTNEGRPNSVYVAYPGSPVQIEVYDPDAERAMRIATSGDLRPVE